MVGCPAVELRDIFFTKKNRMKMPIEPTKIIEPYKMHPLIEAAYSQIHNDFDNDESRQNYKNFNTNKAQRALDREDPLFAAFNFHYYFPTHYFKACHALQSDEIIGMRKLSAWLRYNPFLTIIDVGCGDGAGSTAVIDTILRLRESDDIDPRPIQILSIGIDPNINGLMIFEEMMEILQKSLSLYEIDLKYEVCPYLVSQASTAVDDMLYESKTYWNHPSLSHVIAIASNLTDLLKIEHKKEREKFKKLRTYKSEPFGQQLSSFYRQIFEGCPIDHLHMLTIDTEPETIKSDVTEMLSFINSRFSERGHKLESEDIRLTEIPAINPGNSFWKEKKGVDKFNIPAFVVSVCHIHNSDLNLDDRWQEITSLENLELAWARARQEILRESLSDEIEIKLFEQALDSNLDRLHFELDSYAIHIGYISSTMIYGIPKDIGKYRPKGLTWLETEIIMIAIIQVIGKNILRQNLQSYAYRLSPENSPERGSTEYLYERWTDAWKKFRSDIEQYAKNFPDGVVYKTDIKSFFTHILQARLMNMIKDELNIEIRIEWLVDLLIRKEIPEHEAGKGLVQGSIGSGFWANLYLLPIDYLFPVNDIKNRRLFRYVDDIIVVIPNPEDAQATENLVLNSIGELELEPNLDPNKTNKYSVPDFLSKIPADEELDFLQNSYEKVIDSLWQMDIDLRSKFQEGSDNFEFWWSEISLYRSCLTELGLYISEAWVSREISRIINSETYTNSDLIFPGLPDTETIANAKNWATEFLTLNATWDEEAKKLKGNLTNLFKKNLMIINAANEIQDENEILLANRKLRFAANRLGILGLENIHSDITDLLLATPWKIREHKRLIENLARQAYSLDVWKLIDFHSDENNAISIYMCSMALRGVRYLPRLEPDEWEKLVEFMFEGNIITKLMATETWLVLNSQTTTDKVPCSNEIVEKCKLVLDKENLPDRRLLKNYLLILGRINPKEVANLSLDFKTDPLVAKAYEIAFNSALPTIFQYKEPQILREKYYSTKQRHFDDGSDDPQS